MLLQQRPAAKHHGGSWEFPGGKVETAENPRHALSREIAEELAISLDPLEMMPLGFAEEAGEGARPTVVLFLYSCPNWEGSPRALEGQEFSWFSLADAAALPLAPMDRQLLQGFAG